jgi:large subunit ribosomal protein L20
MARATNNPASRARRRKVLEDARGYFGAKSKLNRSAQEAVDRANSFAYRDRRQRRRQFRRLWIQRINAAARLHGLSYSRFMNGLKACNVEIDRKILAELAVRDEASFARLAELVKAQA